MRKGLRIGLLGVAAAFALAFANGALAAINPNLIVVSPPNVGQGPATSITASVQKSDDPLAKVTIYAPNGYQLNSPGVGSKIGDVKATAVAADLGGAVLPLTGQIVEVDPASVATQSAQCDPVTHAAVWMMQLTAAGQQLPIPMFIDNTVGTETAFGVFKIVVCLPPPDVPAGTPGRATFGARLLTASFDANAFTNPAASGEFRWRSVWTPYTPGTGVANAAGTVEAQSIVRLPTEVTVSAKKAHVRVKGRTRTVVTITGKLSENAKAIPAELVTVEIGKTKKKLYRLKAVMTNQNGVFTKQVVLSSSQYVLAEATLPNRQLGAAGCTASFGPAVKCVSAFVGGDHVLSQVIRVTP